MCKSHKQNLSKPCNKHRRSFLYKIEKKLRYLEYSSQRFKLRMEGVEEEEEEGEEADNETWDQCQEKVSSTLKCRLEINNVKVERAHIIPRRKRIHNKDKLQTIIFKFYSYEDKESKKKAEKTN